MRDFSTFSPLCFAKAVIISCHIGFICHISPAHSILHACVLPVLLECARQAHKLLSQHPQRSATEDDGLLKELNNRATLSNLTYQLLLRIRMDPIA